MWATEQGRNMDTGLVGEYRADRRGTGLAGVDTELAGVDTGVA